MGGLELIHALFTATIDHPVAVAHNNVLVRHAQRLDQGDARQTSGTGARHDDLKVLKIASCNFAGIDQSRSGDDGGTMLVIMKNRNIA
jgi:hypothetical protein